MDRRARASLIAATFVVPLLVADGAAAQDALRRDLAPIQKRLLSGFASLAREHAAQPTQAHGNFAGVNTGAATNYTPGANGQCSNQIGSNSRVNQDCIDLTDPDLPGRGQAKNEASIAQNPMNPRQIVAAFNDYRRGDGTCGAARSTNGGASWQDSTVPTGFVRGLPTFGTARQYYQAAGDPSVAWDTKGNAYLSCQMFLRGNATAPNPDQSSGLYVFRSTGNGGASWNFPGRPVVENDDVAGTGASLLDKQLMTVDATVGSPFQDRVYVTWTLFAADGTAYIYSAYSSDYGESFSAPVLVSGDSALCTITYGVPTPQGRCNENQYSQPFTGPDGALYVTWSNFNNAVTGQDNRNQILLAKSVDGGQTFSAPVKVADYYDLPDCGTYQGKDAGRACVPEKGGSANSFFRASNYPSGAVDPTNANRIVVGFGSYINAHSNAANGCTPAGFSAFGYNLYDGVKTAGACNNDILISVSTDGGASFTGGATDPRQLTSATPAAGQATSSQWFQWLAFNRSGKLVVSYYDRQYGNDEVTGYSDVSISASSDLTTFGVRRATSSSLPPPTQFSGSFWGDYAGLSALDTAHPIWSDTRNPEFFLCPGTGTSGTPPAACTASADNATVANTQDAFTASVPIP